MKWKNKELGVVSTGNTSVHSPAIQLAYTIYNKAYHECARLTSYIGKGLTII